MTTWRGLDERGTPVKLSDADARRRWPELELDGDTVHRGRLRLATSARAAQGRGWSDVAALFSGSFRFSDL